MTPEVRIVAIIFNYACAASRGVIVAGPPAERPATMSPQTRCAELIGYIVSAMKTGFAGIAAAASSSSAESSTSQTADEPLPAAAESFLALVREAVQLQSELQVLKGFPLNIMAEGMRALVLWRCGRTDAASAAGAAFLRSAAADPLYGYCYPAVLLAFRVLGMARSVVASAAPAAICDAMRAAGGVPDSPVVTASLSLALQDKPAAAELASAAFAFIGAARGRIALSCPFAMAKADVAAADGNACAGVDGMLPDGAIIPGVCPDSAKDDPAAEVSAESKTPSAFADLFGAFSSLMLCPGRGQGGPNASHDPLGSEPSPRVPSPTAVAQAHPEHHLRAKQSTAAPVAGVKRTAAAATHAADPSRNAAEGDEMTVAMRRRVMSSMLHLSAAVAPKMRRLTTAGGRSTAADDAPSAAGNGGGVSSKHAAPLRRGDVAPSGPALTAQHRATRNDVKHGLLGQSTAGDEFVTANDAVLSHDAASASVQAPSGLIPGLVGYEYDDGVVADAVNPPSDGIIRQQSRDDAAALWRGGNDADGMPAYSQAEHTALADRGPQLSPLLPSTADGATMHSQRMQPAWTWSGRTALDSPLQTPLDRFPPPPSFGNAGGSGLVRSTSLFPDVMPLNQASAGPTIDAHKMPQHVSMSHADEIPVLGPRRGATTKLEATLYAPSMNASVVVGVATANSHMGRVDSISTLTAISATGSTSTSLSASAAPSESALVTAQQSYMHDGVSPRTASAESGHGGNGTAGDDGSSSDRGISVVASKSDSGYFTRDKARKPTIGTHASLATVVDTDDDEFTAMLRSAFPELGDESVDSDTTDASSPSHMVLPMLGEETRLKLGHSLAGSYDGGSQEPGLASLLDSQMDLYPVKLDALEDEF